MCDWRRDRVGRCCERLTMSHNVFISHSSSDKAVAEAICRCLEAHQIRCWIAPRNISAGETWAGSIAGAIVDCQLVLLVFSSGANRSEHVMAEVGLAVDHQVWILPVRIENVEPAGDLEYHLSRKHWFDAIPPPIEQHLDQIRAVVQSRLGMAAPPPEIRPPSGRRAMPELTVPPPPYAKAIPSLADLSASLQADLAALGSMPPALLEKIANALNISAEELTPVNLSAVAGLHLDEGGLSDGDLAYLAKLQNLRSLNLAGNQITDAGVLHLAGMVALQWLTLSGCRQVTAAGLAQLSRLKALQRLHISGAPITDAGVACLAKLKSLRWLKVEDSRMTDSGFRELNKMLAHTKIIH